MKVNDKLIYSVKELFREFLKGRRFNIPEYQRGYKWTEDNINALLNDLNQFSPSENDFYCLQNITITQDGDNKLNVIDGQQRLTTIFLLLSYLGDVGNVLPFADCLLYSVRSTTHDFLQKEVATRKIWTDEIIPEKAKSKDQYYLTQACKAIQTWFSEHDSEKGAMHDKILHNLKVIVNKVESGEEEIVFCGLNGGKVNLDGADLLRAILITRATRQKYADSDFNAEKIESFRAKLGLELDNAAQWWGQEIVSKYFKQLLPNGIVKNERFDVNAYPIDLLYFAFYEAYNGNFGEDVKCENLDIRLFENGIDFNNKQGDDHLEFYEKISEFNLTMQDWFENDEIYNLIGYLMYNFKSTISFSDLWRIWSQEVRTKSDFVCELKKLVRKSLALRYEPCEIKWDDIPVHEINTRFEHLIDFIKRYDADWYHNDMIYPVLALADILPEYTPQKEVKDNSPHRAAITDFARQPKEDKEHIRSQKRKLYTVDEKDLTPEQQLELKEENENGLNSIGNLVLLHQTINRSYQNNDMRLKMDRIFGEAALKKVHIRPYTQSVFRLKLKNLDKNGTFSQEIFWSDDDVREASNILAERIQNYLNV